MDKIKENRCNQADIVALGDALEVVGGKWKSAIIFSIQSGNKRFSEIERNIPKISSKVLANELKDLEAHDLIKRTVYDTSPVTIEYTVTPYAKTLENVIQTLIEWGTNHRKRIFAK